MDIFDLFDDSLEEPINRPFPPPFFQIKIPQKNHLEKKPRTLNYELELKIDGGSTCIWNLLNYAREV